MGLLESAAEFFPKALWQRCMVHFYRNVNRAGFFGGSLV